MVETIESFVHKLQEEGVEAGRAEARKIVEDAKVEAERILAEAREQADRIVKDAQAAAERDLQRGREELRLAARDALLRLRRAITEVLQAVIGRAAASSFSDKEFLQTLLHELVLQYARGDAEGHYPIEIHVSDDNLQTVTDWALRELSEHDGAARPRIDLKGGLKSAGFEYSTGRGTVEVTPESVCAVLSRMVTPRLRELIDQAAGQQE